MISKAEKNYFINIPLTVIGFACLISGFMLTDRSLSIGGINLRSLHIWSGYITTGLIGVHLLMHVNWIKNITKGIFKSRPKAVSVITAVLVSLGICYASGFTGPQSIEQGHYKGQNQSISQFNSSSARF